MKRPTFCARCGLQEGFIISSTGAVVDNRDGFHTDSDVPADPLRTYDVRTTVAINRERLEELLRIELDAKGRAA